MQTLPGMRVSAAEASKLILSGRAPAGLLVEGHLNLSNQPSLTGLPDGLTANSLDLTNCSALRRLPQGLRVRRLMMSGCRTLRELPADLACYTLDLRQTRLRSLPAGIQVEFALDLSDCTELETLPPNLKAGSLNLSGCTALVALPEGLDVLFLNISGCTRLAGWPTQGAVRIGRVIARGCTGLHTLPPWLTHLSQLDVRGCSNLHRIPPWLTVSSWIDLAGTQITALPPSASRARLRWRGVPVEPRIAFHPETITAEEVLSTANVELRRVLIERMGYERFLAQSHATIIDQDRDPGGVRQLVRVPLEGDEPLVCVSVLCPSTGRQYIIRVPPQMQTCHQAVAWIAGFDNAGDYCPVAEA